MIGGLAQGLEVELASSTDARKTYSCPPLNLEILSFLDMKKERDLLPDDAILASHVFRLAALNLDLTMHRIQRRRDLCKHILREQSVWKRSSDCYLIIDTRLAVFLNHRKDFEG